MTSVLLRTNDKLAYYEVNENERDCFFKQNTQFAFRMEVMVCK